MFRTRMLMGVLCFVILPAIAADADVYWPQWRGPSSTGSVTDGNPPIEWSEQKNIRWKTRIPGIGYATPVIWEEKIFVATAIPPDNAAGAGRGSRTTGPVRFIVMALDRATGKILWERTATEAIPHERHHETSTWATGSPCTDGRYVYAFFGSFGVFCYTVDGDPVWEKDLGDMNIRREFGEGTSPALHKDRLVVNWDHEGQSFIVALDTATGREIWRKNRDEPTSWMTPLIVESGGKAQVIASATRRVRSYDLATGDLIWDSEGLTENVIPSPVAADGVVYVISGFRGSVLRAIRLSEAKGNIDGSSAVLWTYDQDTPYVPSPLLHKGLLYFLKSNNGFLTCIDTSTGKAHYTGRRMEGIRDLYASPVGAGDRVYLMSRNGVGLVVQHGPDYKVLASNSLDDRFDASPVIVGNELFLRGHSYLYCVSENR